MLNFLSKENHEKKSIELPKVDLSNYRGKRYELFDSNGNLIESSDTRNIDCEKALKVKELKERCEKEILKNAPIYKQLNASAGRLTKEETSQVNQAITQCRDKCKNKIQLVIDEADIDKLQHIQWD
jgi:hypothetical protein